MAARRVEHTAHQGTGDEDWLSGPGSASRCRASSAFPTRPWHLGLRRLTGGHPIPRQRAPRRLACSLAAIWLSLTGLSFYAGLDGLGYALGGLQVLAALVPTFTDFCIPSFIYTRILRRSVWCPGPLVAAPPRA